MDRAIEELMGKHCNCENTYNKILLEAITVCPDCYSFFSTVTFEVPRDKLPEVLARFTSMMREMGLQSKGPVNVEHVAARKAHEKEKDVTPNPH